MSYPSRAGMRSGRSRWAASVVGLAVIGGVLGATCVALAAPAGRKPYVYVADTKRNQISQFRVTNSGALRPLDPASVPSGAFPYGIAVNPQGTSVYAVDVGPNGQSAKKVSQYTIDPSTGRLRAMSPATVPAGNGESIVISPNGENAYVNDNSAVSQYSIDPSTGALRPLSPPTVASGANTGAIAVTPNGRYAYVATCAGCPGIVRKHSARPASSMSTAARPTIWEYRISPSTGALSTKPFAIVASGNGPQWLAIAPNGRSAYLSATGGGRGAVWQYTIDPTTGKLTPKSPATAASGSAPHDAVIAPNGKNAYVITVANDKIAQYRINQATGTLGLKPVSTATTVLHPEAIAIAANGKNAYVTSENDPELSQYTINPTTGKIKPMTPATVGTKSGALGLAVTP